MKAFAFGKVIFFKVKVNVCIDTYTLRFDHKKLLNILTITDQENYPVVGYVVTLNGLNYRNSNWYSTCYYKLNSKTILEPKTIHDQIDNKSIYLLLFYLFITIIYK